MPVTIKKLTCRVKVKAGKAKTSLHQEVKAGRPAMEFVLPAPQPRGETGPEPSTTASGGAASTHSGANERADAKSVKADARAVADRVYELMKQEAALARLRGGTNRKG